jgi:hypothetical protein
MQLDVKDGCPLNQFSPCRKLDCAWFIKVVGKHPNTGVDVEEWGCAVAWLPVMLIENGRLQGQTGAAVESLRNEIVKTGHSLVEAANQARLLK